MLSQTRSQSSGQSPNEIPVRILASRNDYRSCHIRVSDQEQRLAAILVDKKYYSFFRAIKSEQQALELCKRLARRGDTTAITRTAKGFAIWVLEPEAILDNPSKTTIPQHPIQQAELTLCKIVESRSQYQPCHVRVPDLDKRLAAVQVDGKYYSLLKVVKDQEQALEVASRLVKRGNETVVIKNARDYTVWVIEPEAILDF